MTCGSFRMCECNLNRVHDLSVILLVVISILLQYIVNFHNFCVSVFDGFIFMVHSQFCDESTQSHCYLRCTCGILIDVDHNCKLICRAFPLIFMFSLSISLVLGRVQMNISGNALEINLRSA